MNEKQTVSSRQLNVNFAFVDFSKEVKKFCFNFAFRRITNLFYSPRYRFSNNRFLQSRTKRWKNQSIKFALFFKFFLPNWIKISKKFQDNYISSPWICFHGVWLSDSQKAKLKLHSSTFCGRDSFPKIQNEWNPRSIEWRSDREFFVAVKGR